MIDKQDKDDLWIAVHKFSPEEIRISKMNNQLVTFALLGSIHKRACQCSDALKDALCKALDNSEVEVKITFNDKFEKDTCYDKLLSVLNETPELLVKELTKPNCCIEFINGSCITLLVEDSDG